MTDLRKKARGQPCMVREPGICNGRWETVVLAHLRLPGIAGMGQKPDDEIAVLACSSCHDALDGRAGKVRIDPEYILHAYARTWKHWKTMGISAQEKR